MDDAVVIGAGIAGTTLALYLLKSGRRVLLIGDRAEGSSHVAAGIMNPITGRKFALSWNYPELLKEAIDFYSSHAFPNHFHLRPVFRALLEPKDYNQWISRSADPVISEYGKNLNDDSHFQDVWKMKVTDWLRIEQGGRLNISCFLKDSHDFLSAHHSFLTRKVSKSDVDFVGKRLVIKEAPAAQIFIAEGAPFHNFLFPQIPVRPAKGEVLLLHSDDLPKGLILKNQYFLVHLGGKKYWFGSNYERNVQPLPTEKTYLKMTNFLNEHALFTYSIEAHRIGMRPTVPDRKPLVGKVPGLENVYIFNGMGSKGSSLSPWCARQLLLKLDNDRALPAEIDLQRYAERWSV